VDEWGGFVGTQPYYHLILRQERKGPQEKNRSLDLKKERLTSKEEEFPKRGTAGEKNGKSIAA